MERYELERLRSEQQKAIEETKASIRKLKAVENDYRQLKKVLHHLADKTTHEVMVPIGPLAFMPGKLIHTNEIMVFLGDLWFAERSTKQSIEIVERRVQNVESQVEQLNRQYGLLEPRLEFTSRLHDIEESEDVQEIKEEYDEKAEQVWRERHRELVRKEKMLQNQGFVSESADIVAAGSAPSCAEDVHLWKRLEYLEHLEKKDAKLGSQMTSPEVIPVEKCEDSNSDAGNSSDSGSSDEIQKTEPCIITFQHSEIKPQPSNAGSEVLSPADIYRIFYKPPSILKKQSQPAVADRNVTFSDSPQLIQVQSPAPLDSFTPPQPPPPVVAITDSIVENPVATVDENSHPDVYPKRISRFKAARMARKSGRND